MFLSATRACAVSAAMLSCFASARAQVAVPPPAKPIVNVPQIGQPVRELGRDVGRDAGGANGDDTGRQARVYSPRGDAEIPESLIADLDSTKLLTREEATHRIASSAEFGMGSVRRAMEHSGLSAEQKQRLSSAGYEIFKATPRGAMGVQFEGATASGVMVRPAQAGFDASRVLKADDTIRAIDGRRVEDQEEIRVAIISREPGESLPLTIIRDGVPIEASVRLGSYAELRNSQGLDDSVLAAAWAARKARTASGGEAPLVSGLSDEQWAASADRQTRARLSKTEPTHDPFSGEQIRSPLPKPIIAAISMGGQVRDQMYAAARELAALTGGVRIRAGNDIIVLPNQRGRARAERNVADQARRQALFMRRQTLNAKMQDIMNAIADPATSDPQRARLKTELVRVSTENAAIEQELLDLFRQP